MEAIGYSAVYDMVKHWITDVQTVPIAELAFNIDMNIPEGVNQREYYLENIIEYIT